jgi:hypothetical protein
LDVQVGGVQGEGAVADGSLQPPLATDDARLASLSATTIRDLPPGWTLVHDAPVGEQGLRPPPRTCAPGRPSGRRSAGWDRQFSYLLSPDGQEAGHLTVTVLVQATKEEAAVTSALVQDPDYQRCQATRGLADLAQASGSTPAPLDSAALGIPAGLSGKATRTRVAYAYRGVSKVSIQDSYDVVVGRVLLRMGFEKCCEPFADTTESSVLSVTAARFAASPLGP